MADERTQRRLAAILIADVVGYSRLMEVDEQLTRARLRALHAELIEPRIAADGGRIVKTMGDGFLAEFPSVVDAVRNALVIQCAMRYRNAEAPESIRIELRVGVNVGDVIIEGDDIHGDGVNIAARLEGLCGPGEVYVSGVVYEQAAGKLDATFDDLGEQAVKNIAKPVRVYRARTNVAMASRSDLQTTDISSPGRDMPSIAVLPFDNLSDDPQQEYFSDGMAEDLITDISKISGLSVTARNSSFAFKSQTLDIVDIAKKLRVKHIVEGSVRKMGDRLRINAQLIDGTDGRHVWAERYDGNISEIFEFQDNIREEIVSALQVSLTAANRVLTERKPTSSVEAYDLFLKGRRASYHRDTQETLLEGIKCLEAAIEIDPNFADAYGYLSHCYFYGWTAFFPGFEGALDRAYQLAEKGAMLDRASAIGLMRLGLYQPFLGQYDQIIANFEKAIAIDPNNAEIYATFGMALNYLGDPERALEMSEKALGLEVFSPPLWEFFYAGISYLLLHQYDKALLRFNRMVEQAPKFLGVRLVLACVYVELDRLSDARNAIESALNIVPELNAEKAISRLPFRTEKHRNLILDSVRRAGLPE